MSERMPTWALLALSVLFCIAVAVALVMSGLHGWWQCASDRSYRQDCMHRGGSMVEGECRFGRDGEAGP